MRVYTSKRPTRNLAFITFYCAAQQSSNSPYQVLMHSVGQLHLLWCQHSTARVCLQDFDNLLSHNCNYSTVLSSRQFAKLAAHLCQAGCTAGLCDRCLAMTLSMALKWVTTCWPSLSRSLVDCANASCSSIQQTDASLPYHRSNSSRMAKNTLARLAYKTCMTNITVDANLKVSIYMVSVQIRLTSLKPAITAIVSNRCY